MSFLFRGVPDVMRLCHLLVALCDNALFVDGCAFSGVINSRPYVSCFPVMCSLSWGDLDSVLKELDNKSRRASVFHVYPEKAMFRSYRTL